MVKIQSAPRHGRQGRNSDDDCFPDNQGHQNWDNILGNTVFQCFRVHSEDAGLVL